MRDTKQLSPALLSLRRFDARDARRVACVLLALAAVVCGIQVWFAVSANSSKRGSIAPAIQSVITNPLTFAKSHVTGGIGALLLAGPGGLPEIRSVVAGSPAATAGLCNGDVILEINGISTRGRTLAQNVDCIRGIASFTVALTIQRTGSTNLNCVIHRRSWNGMGITQ